MTTKFLSFLLLALLPSLASSNVWRGRRKALIGSSAAGEGEIPEFVYFATLNGGRCGGTLISDTEVLTAASCVAGGAPAAVCIYALDALCVNSASVLVEVSGAFINTDYDANLPAINNVAVIRLAESCSSVRGSGCDIMTLNDGIHDMNATGTTIKQFGLGTRTQGEIDYPNRLRKTTTLESVTDADCQAVYGTTELPTANEAEYFCANKDSAVGACDGDYGGPAVITAMGSTTQVGIMVQVNFTSCGDPLIPDVFIDVDGQSSWIADALSSDDTNVDVEELPCFSDRVFGAVEKAIASAYRSTIAFFGGK